LMIAWTASIGPTGTPTGTISATEKSLGTPGSIGSTATLPPVAFCPVGQVAVSGATGGLVLGGVAAVTTCWPAIGVPHSRYSVRVQLAAYASSS
jgi:hypothetical protein